MKMAFTSDNRVQTGETFPKLKLELGEKKRIVCIEDPEAYYVHTIRAPKITSGRATEETKQRKDGTTYPAFVQEFISNPICLGDPDVLVERGVDPRNCPACASAVEIDNMVGPKRRFAMHVFAYTTKPSSWEVKSPFGGDVVVWGFTDKVFNELVDYQEINGDLRKRDLILGPCEDKIYQKFDIKLGNDAEWMKDAARKAYLKEIVEDNKAEDLAAFCGRKVKKDFLEQDVNRAVKQWRIATGGGAEVNAAEAEVEAAQLNNGLRGLLGEDESTSVLEKPAKSGTLDFQNLLNDLG